MRSCYKKAFNHCCSYLYSVFGVGGFVDASFTDGERPHANVLLEYVAVAEEQVLAVQLLQRKG